MWKRYNASTCNGNDVERGSFVKVAVMIRDMGSMQENGPVVKDNVVLRLTES